MNYVVVGLNDGYLNMIHKFIVSLFEVGNFKGRLLILYYGDRFDTLDDIKSIYAKSVDVLNLKPRYLIHNTMHMDLYENIDIFNDDDKIAIYDIDIYFQRDMNHIFDNNIKRLMLVPEYIGDMPMDIRDNKNYFEYFLMDLGFGMFLDGDEPYERIHKLFYKKLKVNAGFIYGYKQAIKDMLQYMISIFEREYRIENMVNNPELDLNYVKARFGSEEFILNTYVDLDLDTLRCIYCFPVHQINSENVLKKDGLYYYNNELVTGVHLQREKALGHVDNNVYKDIYREKYNLLNTKTKNIIDHFNKEHIFMYKKFHKKA